MNRRRFLTMTACMFATRATGATLSEWQGTGFGAALSVQLVGTDPIRARRTFRKIAAEVEHIESHFSLYRDSALTRLNRDGHLAWPSHDFQALLQLCGQVHIATSGAFDPTVQPLWRANAEGRDPALARAAIGWYRMTVARDEIRLSPGQALTFNGIAQGWAADRIALLLKAQGYDDALIDMGEIQAIGHGPQNPDWLMEIASPSGKRLGETRLTNRALATSSPRGTVIGTGHSHIIGPAGQAPLWSTISVSAPQAAVADALSTAFCLMERDAMTRALAAFPGARIEVAI